MFWLKDSFLKVVPRVQGDNGLMKWAGNILSRVWAEVWILKVLPLNSNMSSGEMYHWAQCSEYCCEDSKRIPSSLPKVGNTSLPHPNLSYNCSQKWDSMSPKAKGRSSYNIFNPTKRNFTFGLNPFWCVTTEMTSGSSIY